MIAWVAQVLARDCAEVAVNAPLDSAVADWALGEGYAVLGDPPGLARGPLSGVLAGLGWAGLQRAAYLATAPCDMPRLPADLFARLAQGLTEHAGAAMAASGGDLHPLCAVWRTDRRGAVADMLADGRHPSMRAALAAVDADVVEFSDTTAFANVNVAGDLE